jgi:hypothetical protein
LPDVPQPAGVPEKFEDHEIRYVFLRKGGPALLVRNDTV